MVRLPTFAVDDSIIGQFLEQQAHSYEILILDLRGNRGGHLTAMQTLLGGLSSSDASTSVSHGRPRWGDAARGPRSARSRHFSDAFSSWSMPSLHPLPNNRANGTADQSRNHNWRPLFRRGYDLAISCLDSQSR